MRRRDVAELTLLAALWGASFLFMRLGAADFGPVALVFVRVALAGAVLLPLLAWRGETAALGTHWRAIAFVGVLNSAVPFLLFMVGALVLSAGLMSIFNATVPLWGALIAWLWLHERPSGSRAAGLAIGFVGVLGLAWSKASFTIDPASGISPAWAIAACLAATLLYAWAAHLSRRWLSGVPPMALAAGSQLASSALLVVPAVWLWPAVWPGPSAWAAAAALALGGTALALVLYFRLIANTGATNAMSVTFMIPAFAILWGALFLGERPTLAMWAGSAVILLGTALATGLLRLPQRGRPDTTTG